MLIYSNSSVRLPIGNRHRCIISMVTNHKKKRNGNHFIKKNQHSQAICVPVSFNYRLHINHTTLRVIYFVRTKFVCNLHYT